MNIGITAFVCSLLLASPLVAAENEYHLKKLTKAPEGLSAAIAEQLDPSGFQIIGPDGPILDIWFLKSLKLIPDFKQTSSVKYPLTPGQLVGALRITSESLFMDFRGHELHAGVHTIRYAHQPQDGNHFAPMLDFLLALPTEEDEDPSVIDDYDVLTDKSTLSTEEHPAIISLLPVKTSVGQATLVYDEDRDFQILSLPVKAIQKGSPKTVQLRFVVVGITDE